MSYLARQGDQQPLFTFKNDLQQPIVGKAVPHETVLMFAYLAGGIAAILYLPWGLLSAAGIAIFAYSDVTNTIEKGGRKDDPFALPDSDDDTDHDDAHVAAAQRNDRRLSAGDYQRDYVQPQHDLTPPTIGANTRLNAIPVSSTSTPITVAPTTRDLANIIPFGRDRAEQPHTEQPHTQNSHTEHSHVGQPRTEQPHIERLATPAASSTPAQVMTPTQATTHTPSFIRPDTGREYPLLSGGEPSRVLLDLPVAVRGEIVLDALESSGANIKRYINRPLLATLGAQRTGKTTLLTIMAILEKAIYGRKIFYVTGDRDVYPVAFDGVAYGSRAIGSEALQMFGDTVNTSNTMASQTWILDEFATLVANFSDSEKLDVWLTALTGISKRAGRARFSFHGITLAACGVPKGYSGIFKQEMLVSKGERDEPSSGIYQPKGRYELYASKDNDGFSGTGEYQEIPKWLYIDRNDEYGGLPCPVRSLLQFFPEFDLRKTGGRSPFLVQPKPAYKPLSAPASDGNNDGADVFAVNSVQGKVASPTPLPTPIPTPIPVSAAAETGEEDEDTSPVLPGTGFRQNTFIKRVAGYIKKAEGPQTASAICRNFRSDQRNAVRPYIPVAMRVLATRYGDSYHLDHEDGVERIYYRLAVDHQAASMGIFLDEAPPSI